ncbi:MAG: hypothetical protein IPN74_17785 [Haliscomenobacter sp.]|nr:hypothetical protein [Haliscomenobacter sp.]
MAQNRVVFTSPSVSLLVPATGIFKVAADIKLVDPLAWVEVIAAISAQVIIIEFNISFIVKLQSSKAPPPRSSTPKFSDAANSPRRIILPKMMLNGLTFRSV